MVSAVEVAHPSDGQQAAILTRIIDIVLLVRDLLVQFLHCSFARLGSTKQLKSLAGAYEKSNGGNIHSRSVLQS